jgi:hypothetical protein
MKPDLLKRSVFDPELEALGKLIYAEIAPTLYPNVAMVTPWDDLLFETRERFCKAALAVRSQLAGEVAL